MLFYSGPITEKTMYNRNHQKNLEEFSRRTGIHVFPHFSFQGGPPDFLITPEILESDIRIFSCAYNLNYLPEERIMDSLLYPIFVCRWHTTPTHYTKRSGWKNYQLIYTHSGAGIMNADNQVYYLQPDTMFLLDCRPYHYYFSIDSSGWEYSFVHFDGPSADLIYEQISQKGLLFTNLKNSRIEKKYDALVELCHRNPDDFDLRFHMQLTSFLSELTDSNAARPDIIIPPWLSQIQSFIIENYNKDWSIKDLANQSCLSESRFSHVFRETFDVSPIGYRDYLRIEHAKELLQSTSLSVEEIGQAVGYGTIPGFYSAFSKHTDLTPAKFRKQIRSGDSHEKTSEKRNV